MKKVVTTGLVFLMVVFTLMLAGCGSSDPVDIVKVGELYNYQGKAIGETFDRVAEAEGWTIAWEDSTSSETGSDILAENDKYNSLVSTSISNDGSTFTTLWWLVNTDDKTFELLGAINDGEVYTSDDKELMNFLEAVFTY